MSKYTSFFSYTIQNKYNYDIDMKYLHNSMLQYDIFSFFTISTNKQKKEQECIGDIIFTIHKAIIYMF